MTAVRDDSHERPFHKTRKIKMSKVAKDFRELSKMCLVNPKGAKILQQVGDELIVSFHRMNNKLLTGMDCKGGEETLLRNDYPFVRVSGLWYVSLVKMYMYLMHSRRLLAQFEDRDIVACYDGIQAASRYYDAYKLLDQQLKPKQYQNLEEYTEKQTELYMQYQSEQLSIFGRK